MGRLKGSKNKKKKEVNQESYMIELPPKISANAVEDSLFETSAAVKDLAEAAQELMTKIAGRNHNTIMEIRSIIQRINDLGLTG